MERKKGRSRKERHTKRRRLLDQSSSLGSCSPDESNAPSSSPFTYFLRLQGPELLSPISFMPPMEKNNLRGFLAR